MKKLNVICASIAALCSMSVSAGSLSGTTTFAQEIFGTTTGATTAVTPGFATYTVSTTTGIAVNSGGKLYFTVTLGNGAKFDEAEVAGTDLAGTMISLISGIVNPVATFSADKATAVFEITAGTDKIIGVGSNIVYTPQTGSVVSVKSALGTAGGTVSLTAGLSAFAANYTTPANGTTPADLDGPAASTTFARSADALTSVVTATVGSTKQIDLTVTPAGTAYTSTGTSSDTVAGSVKFAEISFAEPSSAPTDATNAGPVDFTTLWGAGASLAVDVTPNTAFVQGGKVYVKAGTSCGATDAAATVASDPLTSVTAAAKVTLTIPYATLTALTAADTISVCMGVSADTPKKDIKEITPVISASLTPATAVATYDKVNAAAASGYALAYNGAVVDVLTYWPGALDAFNYKGYLRITNTGSVTANVSFAHVNKTTGALFNAAVIMANLAPGESRLISTVAIDGVAGAAPSNLESGRARITAPTNGLRVQSLLQTGNDAPIEYRANNGL